MRKYAVRHWFGMAAAAVVAGLLIAFAVTEAVQLRRIQRERDRANRVTDFMTQMFKVVDPGEARGNSITAREVLDKASKEIDSGLAKDPEMQAQMMHTMGEVYYSLGLYKEGESLLRRALEIRTRVLGPDNRDTLSSMGSLSQVLTDESNFLQAEKYSRESFEGGRKSLGTSDPDTLLNGLSLSVVLLDLSRFPECEAVLRELEANVGKVKDPEVRESIAQR